VLSARHASELENVRARAEGRVAVEAAKAEGAAELARSRAAEVGRLAAQVEELREQLGRASGTASRAPVPGATAEPPRARRRRHKQPG
jgi:HAMP domain-containing protein